MPARIPSSPPGTTRPSQAAASAPAGAPPAPQVVDLDHYAPAYFTWIANKLSRGASQAYLSCFGVGIETWRVLVLLAIESTISAQRACGSIGMDKSSMSRCFKAMQARGLITLEPDPADGRARIARITPDGRALHDRIREIAMVREKAFLAVLNEQEQASLLQLLQRLHDNLPAVESATREYLARQASSPGRGRRKTGIHPARDPLNGASA